MKTLLCILVEIALVSCVGPSLSATLYVYDLSDRPSTLATYDEEVFVATVQGVANRNRPKLFVVKNAKIDGDYLTKMPETEGVIAKAVLEKIADLEEFARLLKRDLKGVCVWDPRVPATLNVAITAAGAENLAVVRYDTTAGSLYQRLVASEDGPRLPVILDLVGKFKEEETIPDTDIESTGSPKCDAYLWAKARYLDTGKAGPTLLYNCDGYRTKLFDQPPATQKLLRIIAALHLDYAVAQRAFAFDLSPFDDEYPKDDYRQRKGEDVRTMKAILASASKQAKGGLIRVLGFPHFEIKYSDTTTGTYSAGGKHSAADLESAYGKMLSLYNAYATGSLQCDNPNFSVYCKLPKPEGVVQNPGMSEEKLTENQCLKSGKVTNRTFLTFIIGDFDNLSWIYSELLPRLWEDKARGTLPLSWAINPELVEVFPNGFKRLLDTRSKIDYFVAPASGAGYINPGFLTDRKGSDIPDGLSAWVEHCKKRYRLLDYTATGNVVNGLAGPLTEKVARAYAEFSPAGIASREGVARQGSSGSGEDYMLVGATPVIKLLNIPPDVSDAADAIHNTRREKFPNFIAVWCPMGTPSFISSLLGQIADEKPDRNYTVLDPYAFFDLLRRHLQDVQVQASGPRPY